MALHDFAPLPQDDPIDTKVPPPTFPQDELPLYEPRATSSSNDDQDSHPLPSPSSGPHLIRAYLVQLLMAQGGVDAAQAHDIAAKWTIGAGTELRKFTAGMYKDIFGTETGWVLYRLVRLRVLAEERAGKPEPHSAKVYKRRAAGLGVLLATLFSVMVFAGTKDWAELFVPCFFGFVVTLVFFIFACVKAFETPETPEERVSRELAMVHGSAALSPGSGVVHGAQGRGHGNV